MKYVSTLVKEELKTNKRGPQIVILQYPKVNDIVVTESMID